jgi:hypothetical protein
MNFFGDENLPFCYKKGPKQHGEGNFLKKNPKTIATFEG